ncbi:Urocanate hydratase [Acipenser ruthenus]|uniref:Urocanate hydratase n=1 Tax=Acipenser ruthenus TaxID=7906 RepID=A0A444UZB2_ACIRT|nr:Urocanate hydratase [Acipenser ruthenus]
MAVQNFVGDAFRGATWVALHNGGGVGWDIFSLGFGPFRWVCTSGDPEDLATTDVIASTVLEDIGKGVSDLVRQQYDDNIRWIREAGKHNMVVGSQARILYSDQKGRVSIALAINTAIADGRIKVSCNGKPEWRWRAPACVCGERLVREYDTTGELLVDLGSDQTSCHNPFSGGYCPVGLTEQEAGQLMHSEPARFRSLVQER